MEFLLWSLFTASTEKNFLIFGKGVIFNIEEDYIPSWHGPDCPAVVDLFSSTGDCCIPAGQGLHQKPPSR